MSTEKKQRYPELDILRGLAVLAMIGYHFVFDLDYLGDYLGFADIPVTEGGWKIFARSIAITFILLVGVSLAISKGRDPSRHHYYYTVRGLKLLACGFGITAVTLLFVPAQFIFFGILHFIGLSVIIAPYFFRLGWWNALLGMAIIAAGMYANNELIATEPLLAWLGIPHYGMQTLDWFPMLPWFGVVLLGLAIGGFLYPDGKPRWRQTTEKENKGNENKEENGSAGLARFTRILAWPGRHSLIIYLLHQPILLLVLLVVSGKLQSLMVSLI